LNDTQKCIQINKLIDETKYKIETLIFSKKSILFINENSRFYSRYCIESFLLTVNDEYIRECDIFIPYDSDKTYVVT
jgi:hypothetical protein